MHKTSRMMDADVFIMMTIDHGSIRGCTVTAVSLVMIHPNGATQLITGQYLMISSISIASFLSFNAMLDLNSKVFLFLDAIAFPSTLSVGQWVSH